MAMQEGSITLKVGGTNTSYNNSTAYATLTANTNGETVNWELTMSDISSNKPFIYLYLKINNTVLYNKYYQSEVPSNTFPRGNGTSASGVIAIDADATSIPITLGVGPSVASIKFKKEQNLTRVYYTAVTTGTTAITDNYNNTFTIKATKGSSGTNNTAGGPTTLKWGYTSDRSSSYTNGQTITLTKSGTGNTRKVYAESTTSAQYGGDKKSTTSKDIIQFFELSEPGTPQISYNKSRLTIKENWTYSWTAATTSNSTTSPIKGYQMYVYKNGTAIKGLSVSGNTITKGTGDKAFVNRGNTSTTVSFDPAALGFKPGDKVRFGVKAYTQWSYRGSGVAADTTNGAWKFTDEVKSTELTVQNAGVVGIKVNGEWVEGQVYVKANNKWEEAETVSVKVNDKWEESE